LIDCFDKDLEKIDLKTVQVIVSALSSIPAKELMKIAEGGYLTLLSNLSN